MVTKEQSTAKNTDKVYDSDRVSGSMESLSALQITADTEGLDA